MNAKTGLMERTEAPNEKGRIPEEALKISGRKPRTFEEFAKDNTRVERPVREGCSIEEDVDVTLGGNSCR